MKIRRLRTQGKLNLNHKALKDFTKDKILTWSKFGNPIWIKKEDKLK